MQEAMKSGEATSSKGGPAYMGERRNFATSSNALSVSRSKSCAHHWVLSIAQNEVEIVQVLDLGVRNRVIWVQAVAVEGEVCRIVI